MNEHEPQVTRGESDLFIAYCDTIAQTDGSPEQADGVFDAILAEYQEDHACSSARIQELRSRIIGRYASIESLHRLLLSTERM